jgi:peptide/nickel transport system substrate-binding protein
MCINLRKDSPISVGARAVPSRGDSHQPHSYGLLRPRLRLMHIGSFRDRPRAWTLLILLILLTLLVSCSDTPSLPPNPPRSPFLGPYNYTPPPSRQPHSTVIFSDTQFPDAVNPLFSGSPADLEVSAALWSAPIVYDQQFHVHPNQLTEVPLPENGDVQDGGKTIIMHLRHDLRWSDGQPILASDFQYWWQLDQDPNTGALITGGYDQIASIDTPDDFTVVLHMKHPLGPYLLYLPYAAPKHAWSKLQPIDLQNDPSVYLAPTVTDGPYKLSNIEKGRSYTMVPNPYYTSTTFHGPFLSRLIYRSYSNLQALTIAVQNQQTDLSQGYMEPELPQLAHLPSNIRLIETPAAAYEHLDFNNANPLLQKVNVRRAIAMAIDRCAIITKVLHMPDCSRLANSVEPPPSLVYDPTIAPIPYNPTAARQLLAQVGWLPGPTGILKRQGQPLVLHLVTTSDNPLRAAAAQLIAHNLQAIGITVKLAYYSLNALFAFYSRGGILATGAFDLAMFGYANGPDPDDEYSAFHSSQIPTSEHPSLGNYARVHDPIIDTALTSARNTTAFAQRMSYYHQFLQQLANQLYILPLYTGVNILTLNPRLQNVIPNPNSVANNWNIADWWLQ